MEGIKIIQVKEGILSEQKRLADHIRDKLYKSRTFMLNLMSSPGSGKTTLILKTAEGLKNNVRMAVIEADIDSMVDAEKLTAGGIHAVQLKTGGFCHLDASMVLKGLDTIDLNNRDLIIIENVGNLVCPAEFDTGAIRNVMILSVPEGDDKPLKYPLMFTVCDMLLVNKIDYIDHSDFDLTALKERALALNPKIKILETSGRTGQGIDEWVKWIENEIHAMA